MSLIWSSPCTGLVHGKMVISNRWQQSLFTFSSVIFPVPGSWVTEIDLLLLALFWSWHLAASLSVIPSINILLLYAESFFHIQQYSSKAKIKCWLHLPDMLSRVIWFQDSSVLVAHYRECFRFAVGVHCCMILFAGRISIWQVIVRVVMITEEKLLCYLCCSPLR